jgi:hypothetical protein
MLVMFIGRKYNQFKRDFLTLTDRQRALAESHIYNASAAFNAANSSYYVFLKETRSLKDKFLSLIPGTDQHDARRYCRESLDKAVEQLTIIKTLCVEQKPVFVPERARGVIVDRANEHPIKNERLIRMPGESSDDDYSSPLLKQPEPEEAKEKTTLYEVLGSRTLRR